MVEEVFPETKESLMINKVLLKPKKEKEEPAQRKSLFKTMCKVQGKCFKMVISGGITDNLFSTEMVENISLKKIKHLVSYKVYWLHKGHQILVSEWFVVDFQIDTYKEKIMCDAHRCLSYIVRQTMAIL